MSSKIFTKVATNRVTDIAHNATRPTQTAFMPGYHILEGFVVLYETIHELHQNKMDRVIFKVYFEKAYDKVNWSFLQQAIRLKGFRPKWCEWIRHFLWRWCGNKGQ